MQPLDRTRRNQLDRTVRKARPVAERAAEAALSQLGVGEASAPAYLDENQKALRRRLRTHARNLGDPLRDGVQALDRLIAETAYEHWHRMLFARFLAENELLMYDGVAITLDECEELAADEGAASGWALAARLASTMLPQVFRTQSPVFDLTLAAEYQRELESLLGGLAVAVFQASDSLGWVYQFWQADNKDRINKSEVKIGADELPAVTQLFTEPYMVSFLLDNSLGAWWAARRLSEADRQQAASEAELRAKLALPGVPLEYLRFTNLPSPSGRGAGGEGSESKGNHAAPVKKQKTAIPDDIRKNARELRRTQTDAEQMLWGLLRDRRFSGKKFRRQHPVGRYILDFYCHDLKLAIELDGGQHNRDEAQHADEQRTRDLNNQGIRVVRFWNNEILQQTDAVLEALWMEINSPPSPQTPLPAGEGPRWTPAAGTFDAWPERLADLKTLDPCCGSGHFLVAAFSMLVPMRMAMEELSARDAVDAVLRDNLHGLEIDARCVELAAFALALAAWRYPDAGGYRPLPELQLACSGLAIGTAKADWKQLAPDQHNLRLALDWMHDAFRDAPVLGSLLNPKRADAAKLSEWSTLSATLEQALNQEHSDEQHEAAVVAQGLAKAARLLAGEYHWVITNVPYLSRGKQSERLRGFCERHYPAAKNDLATVFLDRCLELCAQGGTASLVLPQNWLFLTSYRKFREKLLQNERWHLIARLGPGAFETISGEVVKAILLTLSRSNTNAQPGGLFADEGPGGLIRGLDVSEPRTAAEKAAGLLSGEVKTVVQARQLENPDARVAFEELERISLLSDYADGFKGLSTGDLNRFIAQWWEHEIVGGGWVFYQGSVNTGITYGGRSQVLFWQGGAGVMIEQPSCYVKGTKAWGKRGITVTQMRGLPPTLYEGDKFDENAATIIPDDEANRAAIFCYIADEAYLEQVRQIDSALKVTNKTLVKVPFDIDYWIKIAEQRYPNGIPKPYSNDPTQWIFHGQPAQSDNPLQVAVARLLGYRWPAELDAEMELADEQREWVNRCDELLPLADDDGIVCIPPVRGEAAGADRLFKLLVAAYGDAWSNDTLAKLLKQADHAGKTLETWLRDKFFAQHCKLFHHRPFIWHVWDGLKDGFSALVNYHRLDYKTLETLTYTYLGDWITAQSRAVKDGIDGAEEKLAAAQALQKSLVLILKGEAPYDIFVRWKPLAEQPIGWHPDLNDGVRLNIRPFMAVPDIKKKGAGILRDKPNIKWTKDRGKDVESAPWYLLGLQYGGKEGDRINDHHLSLADKKAAAPKPLASGEHA